jgi:hypothetical protein
MGVHKVSAFHPFIFQKSGKSTIIRNLEVPRHFVAYLVFISSIRVDPGPRNRGPTSLLALKIRTPVANTGKLRSIGQVPVQYINGKRKQCHRKKSRFFNRSKSILGNRQNIVLSIIGNLLCVICTILTCPWCSL